MAPVNSGAVGAATVQVVKSAAQAASASSGVRAARGGSPAPWAPWLRGIGGLLILGVVWHVGVLLLKEHMPMAASLAPAIALEQLARLLVDPNFHGHVLASLRRVGVGLAAALAIGVPVGLLIGRSRFAEQWTGGAFQLLRMISPLSWMPVVVMLFGIGDAPIYFLLAFAAVWPLVLNTAAGVKAVSPAWLQLGASLSATRGETLRRIVLPAVLGHILSGLRLAIGIVWIVLVPCEMLGVSEGLGYFILDTRDRLAYGELMAAIVFIGMLGWALDALARAVHRRWSRA